MFSNSDMDAHLRPHVINESDDDAPLEEFKMSGYSKQLDRSAVEGDLISPVIMLHDKPD